MRRRAARALADSLAIQFASESNPQLAMQRNRAAVDFADIDLAGDAGGDHSRRILDVGGDAKDASEVVAAASG